MLAGGEPSETAMTRSASPLRPRAALFVLAVALVPVGAAQTGAQSRASASWKVPRTPWGAPDLQGVWTSADLSVPSEDAPRVPAAPPPVPAGTGGAGDVNPPNHWGERIQRVAFNVSPMTPLGEERAATPRLGGGSFMTGNFAGPEELGTWVRCLSRGMPGAMTPTAYNNNYQIVQSQDHVAVIAEMIHDARMIPLRPQPHIAPSIRQWLGDSRGRWEGDTLIVEVTNITDQASFRGSTASLHVTERYTRTGPDTLHYEVTLEDAAAWRAPWTFFIDLALDHGQGRVFEYACHEGNYGLRNLLSASRAMDAEAAAEARK
jgi:hypothetical protein